MKTLWHDLVVAVSLGFLLSTAALAQAPAAPTTPAATCEAQLVELRSQSATVVQLWRDISQQRGAYEVQMAAARSALGADCPESTPVSQCVIALHARYVDTAQKLAKATTPVKPTAEAKK
jgi:hypothetical protein